jgi:hypothetical protein
VLRFACVLALAAFFSGGASAALITRHATTATYALTLSIGPTEAMYTPAQVKANHPTSGEVMINGGTMSMGGMSMGGITRHLEVHLKSRATGKVVTNVTPKISLIETGGMAMTTKVQAIAMEGVGEGVADLHYGNNVKLTVGHIYKVAAIVKGEKASFTFRA